MRHVFLLFILVVGCALVTPKDRPITPSDNEPSTAIVIMEPVEVTPEDNLKLPQIKYKLLAPNKYADLVPRVEKFFTLLVNDHSILNGQTWEYTNDTPDQIRSKIMTGFDITIKTYTSKLPWSDVIAYHDDWVIRFNTRKLNRPDCAIINTLAHESTHALSFRHGDGRPTTKDMNSFPYWAGMKAEQLCKEGRI